MKKLFMYMMMAVTAIPLVAQNYLTLRYDRPADYWLEALPLGNGRLGAMVYGGVTSDTRSTKTPSGPEVPTTTSIPTPKPTCRKYVTASTEETTNRLSAWP